MSKAVLDAETVLPHTSPVVHQTAHEIQPDGHLVRIVIALAESACKESVDNLNQLLADMWPWPEHVCHRDHSVTALAYCAPDRDLSGTVTVRAHRVVVN
jgi:hypothetical protein